LKEGSSTSLGTGKKKGETGGPIVLSQEVVDALSFGLYFWKKRRFAYFGTSKRGTSESVGVFESRHNRFGNSRGAWENVESARVKVTKKKEEPPLCKRPIGVSALEGGALMEY